MSTAADAYLKDVSDRLGLTLLELDAEVVEACRRRGMPAWQAVIVVLDPLNLVSAGVESGVP